MAEVETLTALSAEFHALPAGKRRAIIAALPPRDRFKGTAVLRAGLREPAGPATGHDGAPACADWLLERLRHRSGEEARAEPRWTMTHASWTALMEVANGLGVDPGPEARPEVVVRSPSLLERLAALLGRAPA
jgi:hypothetical protein